MADETQYQNLIGSGAPAAALAIDYPHGHVIAPHKHTYAQLLYALEGVITVETDNGRWVVPPTRGVWLQAEVVHQVTMRGDVKMRTVFIDPEAIPHLPKESCVLDIPPLLRELIVSAIGIHTDFTVHSREWHLLSLLVLELRSVPVLPLYLPLPTDIRLRAICDALIAHPDESIGVVEQAETLGMSTRTFHRLFLRETGLRYGHWRQQARLLLALESLARKDKVIDVALEHGYASQSAFAAMFKKHFAVSPSKFFL